MNQGFILVDRPTAQVSFNFRHLDEQEVHTVILALRRQFVELSAAIENPQGKELNSAQKTTLIHQRRDLLSLMEQFDGVQPALTQLLGQKRRISVNSRPLLDAQIERVYTALVWYRDNWVLEQDSLRQMVVNVIGYLEDTL